MDSFIKKIILFLPFAFVFYIILIILSGEFAPSQMTKNLNYGNVRAGHLQSRLEEADTTMDVDILVLGSSHAYRGYDPRIFEEKGYRIFNLGSSAQTFLQTKILMEKYIEAMHPKKVIFDVYPTLFASDGVESSLELISKGLVNMEVGRLILLQNNMKLYNTFIFACYKQYLKQDDTVREPIKLRDDIYISGGYVESSQTDFTDELLSNKSIVINDLQWEAFISIIEMLKARKIEFILVQSPITKEKYGSFENIGRFDSLFMLYGNYLNFNKILNLDQKYFLDHSHLNQNGVSVFNAELLEELK